MSAPDAPTIAAIVLAAGMSSRMGSPKPLLPIRGQAMLERILQTLDASRAVSPILVVTGHAAEQLQPIITQHRADAVHNPQYADGEMLSSIKTGVQSLPADVEAAMIVLCDQPLVRADTIQSLANEWRRRRPRILLPTYHGKRGHPVLLSATGFSEIISLPPQATLKTYTSAYASEAVELPVEDDAVVRDIDTPADYAAEQKRS
jgi:molybdenum cofactor cytidylyltransferase